MANPEHVEIVKAGKDAIAKWRNDNPGRRISLGDADLRYAELNGANLSDADLSGARLNVAGLRDSNLFGANLFGADLFGADLSRADVRSSHLNRANLRSAQLTGANLSDADLSNAILSGADACRANLSKAELTRAELIRADLSDANLSDANLSNAELSDAELSRAKLNGADLSGAILSGAILSGAILIGAGLCRAGLSGANLSSAILTGADLSDSDLSGANLTNTQFGDVKGNSANLTNANLTDAVLTNETNSKPGAGLLELASVAGLESVRADSPDFLQGYLARAFAYAHKPNLPEAEDFPQFFEAALANIKALRALYETDHDSQPPAELVKVVHAITDELIKHLKAHPDELYNIRPRQFEELIAEILASYNWEVQLTPESKDGGYDIFAITPMAGGAKTSWNIECKKYAKQRKVGVDIARSLYCVKGEVRAANCMLATTSDFTRGVHDFKASRYDFDLRNFESILEWLNEYRPHPDGKLYVHENRLVLPGEE